MNAVKILRSLILIISTFLSSLYPCTTAVVSGKATADGRPLLLKNRDADELQNRLVSVLDTKYRFVGLVNSPDKEHREVWSGFNSAGFAIMNSAAYNLKGDDTTTLADREGFIMRQALAECASLKDAQGGAAYYEVNNFKFTKYDVNDPAVAPHGYLIRTNYSCAGEENKGFGYIRYSTASELFQKEYDRKKLSAAFLIKDVPRCLIHSFTKTDLTSSLPLSGSDTTFAFFRDYIPRYYSSAATVVQGVQQGEPEALMTMWTVLGFPLTSVIVPVWLLNDGTLPAVMIADKESNAPLCTAALQLKEKVFPVQNDARENYINLAVLMNREQTGIRQKLSRIEHSIVQKAEQLLSGWRKNGLIESEARKFYSWVDRDIVKEFDAIRSAAR